MDLASKITKQNIFHLHDCIIIVSKEFNLNKRAITKNK